MRLRMPSLTRCLLWTLANLLNLASSLNLIHNLTKLEIHCKWSRNLCLSSNNLEITMGIITFHLREDLEVDGNTTLQSFTREPEAPVHANTEQEVNMNGTKT